MGIFFCTLCPVRGRRCPSSNKPRWGGGGVCWIDYLLSRYWLVLDNRHIAAALECSAVKSHPKVAGSLPMKRWGVLLLIASEPRGDKDETHTIENVALYAFPPDRGISELRVNEGPVVNWPTSRQEGRKQHVLLDVMRHAPCFGFTLSALRSRRLFF